MAIRSASTLLLLSLMTLEVADPAQVLAEAPLPRSSGGFWAFEPISAGGPPAVGEPCRACSPIDHFILAALEDRGLAPAPPADRRTLIRRVYFDLLGLPPAPEEIEAFVHDPRPDAYERLVERLLASPHYGERWGQHWLDTVRYAETEGFEYDRTMAGAWRYRDYVIRSFDEDQPYDRFLTEQLAGDEIDARDHKLRIAAGFHRLGPVRRNAGNQEVASSRNEVLAERTDIIGLVFLGLTIGCARCHDHKFDPIPQKDYYRLQAFLAATQEDNIVLAAEDEQTRWAERTEAIQAQIDALKKQIADLTGEERDQVQQQIEQLDAQLPPPLPTICSIRNAEDQRTPIHVLKRGDWDKPREAVGMRPLGVFVSHEAPELPLATSNPRTELAAWLLGPARPLTARVIVNRIWQYHFGRGLVSSANDFGANGARPSHPELLDYLAQELIDAGWRIKPMHRLILLSSTYRQSSRSPDSERGREIDPDNSLLWHSSRRRLSAEEVRDAMLAVSGRLNLRAGGPGVMLPVQEELVGQLYKPSQWQVTPDPAEHFRRSIYLIAKRNLRLPFMEVFDQPPSQTSCARREQSTHAPQALELLNGRISNELAEAFADRLQQECGSNHAQQVERAFLLAIGRSPTPQERQLALEFINEQPAREFALALFNLNAFLYVD